MINVVQSAVCYQQFRLDIAWFLLFSGNLVRTSLSLKVSLLNFTLAVYALVTEIPAVFLLYHSPTWSAAFILFILAVSVWNGGGFYIEVFGRKYDVDFFVLLLPLTRDFPGLNVSLKLWERKLLRVLGRMAPIRQLTSVAVEARTIYHPFWIKKSVDHHPSPLIAIWRLRVKRISNLLSRLHSLLCIQECIIVLMMSGFLFHAFAMSLISRL